METTRAVQAQSAERWNTQIFAEGTCNYFIPLKIPEPLVSVYCCRAQSGCKLQLLARASNATQSRTGHGRESVPSSLSPTGHNTLRHVRARRGLSSKREQNGTDTDLFVPVWLENTPRRTGRAAAYEIRGRNYALDQLWRHGTASVIYSFRLFFFSFRDHSHGWFTMIHEIIYSKARLSVNSASESSMAL